MIISSVVLAAGYGTRMKSELPKVMHGLLGRPMIDWAVAAVEGCSHHPPVLVVGHGQELVRAFMGDRVQYAVQEQLLGTGHAVLQALPFLKGRSDVVTVTYGDMPLLQGATITALVETFGQARARDDGLAIAMLTVERSDPQGFGRIVRTQSGDIVAIVEEADCTPEQKTIRELNPGIYCFDASWLWANLSALQASAKGEYYLTDMVGIAVSQGRRVVTQLAPEEDVNGINTRVQLAHATRVLQRRVLERHLLAGVTIIDSDHTYVDDAVQIGPDTTLLPGCVLQGKTVIGSRCTIGPACHLVDSWMGDECRATYSVLEGARMERRSEIGPFGHLRKGAHLAEGVHMGNFGEVKNSYLGPGTKMGHFSYIGDAYIEGDVNVGAGTITCNYDGREKQKTHIGRGAFLGSDTLLVAPVAVGENATTGAGAVVTHDVPAGALVYGVPAREAPRREGAADSEVRSGA